ncbi:hypothetical protein QK342_10985 [Myroides odoratimimus]|nr:hypothetical protein [Myroides odoratimimus]WHT72235.1 hypothetical protein QK342_10985 [Myroides odoratimimus]WHU36817.1 hypothetical protein QNM93_10970 [Myroides odoratimimus]
MRKESFSILSNVIKQDLWKSLSLLVQEQVLENKEMLICEGEVADKR